MEREWDVGGGRRRREGEKEGEREKSQENNNKDHVKCLILLKVSQGQKG